MAIRKLREIRITMPQQKTIRGHSLPEEEEMEHDDDAGDGQPEDDRQPSQPTSSSEHYVIVTRVE